MKTGDTVFGILLMASLSVLSSVTAWAAPQTFSCQEQGEPTGLKISLTIDGKLASYSIPGKKADQGSLISYSGGSEMNPLFGGFPDWVAQIQGEQGSGYLYVDADLLKSGSGEVGLYRAYFHSLTDCGNESKWFSCTK